jgi:gamma-glutamyltranspeptidase/glutathione hydrolase
MKRSPASCLLLVFLASQSVWAGGGRIPVYAENGMVVSSSEIASQVGRDILKGGGNAIDAAVATALALAVTWPSAGNVGGGGFLVYHGSDGEVTTFDVP